VPPSPSPLPPYALIIATSNVVLQEKHSAALFQAVLAGVEYPPRREIVYKKIREMLFVTSGCHFDRGKGMRENFTVRAAL
jgi:hypothetical protein